jgi:hypothetical protein
VMRKLAAAIVAAGSFEGTLTNPARGESVRSRGHRLIVDNFRTGTTSESNGRVVTAPGGGAILNDSGRIVWDWNGTPDNFDDDVVDFMAGPLEGFRGETDALCQVLAT